MVKKLKAGHFRAYHKTRPDRAKGGKLFGDFPIKDKAFYLSTGWVECAADYTDEPATAPTVTPPETAPTEEGVKRGRKAKADATGHETENL